MLTWLIIFYLAVTLLWTFSRYQRVQDKEVWKKDLVLHIVESLGWLFVLLRSDYGASEKASENSEDTIETIPFPRRGKNKK